MKITVLHGENIEESRKRLNIIRDAIKKRGWDVVEIQSDENVSEKIQGSSLFGEDILYILEGTANLKDSDIKWLRENSNGSESNLLIWEKRNILASVLKKLPSETNIEEFKLAKQLFNFLDNLYPNNLVKGMELYKKVIDKEAIEFVFTMIGNLFRDLYWVSVDSQNCDYPMWRKGKLGSQAKRFGLIKLKKLIKRLSQIDIKSKTGEGSLGSEVEMFVIEVLK